MKEDLIESLLGCLPELVDGIEPHMLANFLQSSLTRQQVVEQAKNDRMFLEMLGILWVDSNPKLWARIGLSSARHIKESLDSLAKEHGEKNLRIALLQDDRQTVRDLAARFAPKPKFRSTGDLHPDKGLILTDGKQTRTISTRGIVEAIDANNVETVGFVRRALALLKTGRQIIIRNLAALDGSCPEALNHIEKPILVDGSNVAWNGRQKPRLANILALRDHLRRAGHFPIYIYIDAALVYQIDQGPKLVDLIESHAVISADAGTTADEAIIRHAIRLGCPVITNDRMIEWDGYGEVKKYKFAFDKKGVTVHEA